MHQKNSPDHRIVVTGMGALTNLGQDAKSTWEGMREGRSGISLIEDPSFSQYEGWNVKIAGEIKNWDPTTRIAARECKRLDRVTQVGLFAADEAVAHSGIDFSKEDTDRCGVVIGSGIGGIKTIEDGMSVLWKRGPSRLSPFTVPRLMVNATTGNISIRFGLRGPASAHATACASSGHAIGDAMRYLKQGDVDVMLVGGTEAAVTPLCVGAFMTMKALSKRNDDPTAASRPFDRDRDGFVLAEGAAMFVIETEKHAKARGAEIYAELIGFGNSADASHITAPDAAGRGAVRSMRAALRDADISPDTIGYINSHGTSTPLGDQAEVAAVGDVFGDHARLSKGGTLLMSSTKSMHGHTLGASGAVELIGCIHAVRDGIVPPTINLSSPDEGFDMDFVANESRERPVKIAMNNTFGFGGHNVTLIVARYEG